VSDDAKGGDARFEDATEDPIRLRAETADDLTVLSALTQDAVAQTSEISWLRKKRRFLMLLNRFRWEDKADADKARRDYERVQSLLIVEDVSKILAQGVDPTDTELVLNMIGVAFEPAEDGMGRVVMTFSGDGAIALEVETLDVRLQDVSRPYTARASAAPDHLIED